jgi:hypothetical protein
MGTSLKQCLRTVSVAASAGMLGPLSAPLVSLIADPKAWTRSCSVFRGTLEMSEMSESGKTSGKDCIVGSLKDSADDACCTNFGTRSGRRFLS